MPKNSVKKRQFINTPKSAVARAETFREAQEAALQSLVAPFANIVDSQKIERARGYSLSTTLEKFENTLEEVNVPAMERLSREMRSKQFIEAMSLAIRALVLKKQARYEARKDAVKKDQERQARAASELTEQELEDDPNRFIVLANKQALARIDELLAKCSVINDAFFLNDERHKKFREQNFKSSDGLKAFQVFIERRLKNAYSVLQSISDSQIKESLAIMILSLASGFQSFETKYINMALMGPPGIGKTTIGRQIALVLSQLLILLEGQCISITAGNLIAQYEGQTTLKTRSQLMAGLENVVLLDEAYALVKCSGGAGGAGGAGASARGDGYGQEAVNEMIDFMSNYLGQYCIIVAGYYDAMQCFFRTNEGFQRRFDATYRFKIEPFTLDKLEPLLERMLPASLNKTEVRVLTSLLPQILALGALQNSASDISALSDDIKSSIGLKGLLFEPKADTRENALARLLYILKGLEFYLKSRNVSILVSVKDNEIEYSIERT